MHELCSAGIVFAVLLVCSGVGWVVRPLLSERHRSRETVELVQVVVTMLVTFAALVLGLQTNSVKANFDQISGELKVYAAELIQLDLALREYGADTLTIRDELKSYTASAIATTWTDEFPPSGDYYLKRTPSGPTDSPTESTYLGSVLIHIQDEIRALQPQDASHQKFQADCLRHIDQVIERRWRLIEAGGSSLSMPFYVVLIFWLGIIFAAFGLSAPRNALSYVTISFAALSIASVMFVMLDLDTPFGGIFIVSSQSMRSALEHMLS
jgi:hypothetical protein